MAGSVACGGLEGDVYIEDLQSEVFNPSCGGSGCHGATNPASGLVLANVGSTELRASLVDAPSTQVDYPLVTSGVLADSYLYDKVSGQMLQFGVQQMPPDDALPETQIEDIRLWIVNGAP